MQLAVSCPGQSAWAAVREAHSGTGGGRARDDREGRPGAALQPRPNRLGEFLENRKEIGDDR